MCRINLRIGIRMVFGEKDNDLERALSCPRRASYEAELGLMLP